MGLLDWFRKTKEKKEQQMEKKSETSDTRRKPVGEQPQNTSAEYYEVLYTQDYTGRRKLHVSPIPPRREWENIASVEKRIDGLMVESKKKTISAAAIEKKVDSILARKVKK